MTLIALPEGMTKEEYLAATAGQKPVQLAPSLEPTSLPPRRPAGRRPTTQQLGASAYRPPARESTRVMDQAGSDLSAALAEMFPEIGVGERSMLARQLAEEYMRERTAARQDLKPQHPTAAKTEQMQVEETLAEETAAMAKQDRVKRRTEQALGDFFRPGKATPIQPASTGTPYGSQDLDARRNKARQEMANARRGMALQAERDKKRKTGKSGPLMQEENRRRSENLARSTTGAAADFKAYASGKRASPGMAQPIQPQDTGTPYGGRSESDMYWEMVDAGQDPVVAQARAQRAFRYAPKT